MVPVRLNVAMARPQLVGFAWGKNHRQPMAIFMACSWNSGTPFVLESTAFKLFRGINPGKLATRQRLWPPDRISTTFPVSEELVKRGSASNVHVSWP